MEEKGIHSDQEGMQRIIDFSEYIEANIGLSLAEIPTKILKIAQESYLPFKDIIEKRVIENTSNIILRETDKEIKKIKISSSAEEAKKNIKTVLVQLFRWEHPIEESEDSEEDMNIKKILREEAIQAIQKAFEKYSCLYKDANKNDYGELHCDLRARGIGDSAFEMTIPEGIPEGIPEEYSNALEHSQERIRTLVSGKGEYGNRENILLFVRQAFANHPEMYRNTPKNRRLQDALMQLGEANRRFFFFSGEEEGKEEMAEKSSEMPNIQKQFLDRLRRSMTPAQEEFLETFRRKHKKR